MINDNYNLWDFDLEGLREIMANTNLEGGFLGLSRLDDDETC